MPEKSRYFVALAVEYERSIDSSWEETLQRKRHAIAVVRKRIEDWVLARDADATFGPSERGTHLTPVISVCSDLAVLQEMRNPQTRPPEIVVAGAVGPDFRIVVGASK